MEENINNNSNLNKIIFSNGNNKEAWKDLIYEINSDNLNSNNNIISKLKSFLIEKKNIEITLDIIDFLVHYGASTIVELIAKKDFLKLILELLKNSSKSSVNIQKKVIFLTQKWAKKYKNENNPKYSAFIDNYNTLRKEGIMFPPSNFKLETYIKYITDDEAQDALLKVNVINKNKEENNFANPFLSEKKELDDIANKKIFNNESSINYNENTNNQEDIDNPYCENNYQDNKINTNNFKQQNNFENDFNKNNNNNNNKINNNNNINNNNYNINNNKKSLKNQEKKDNNNFNEQSNEQNTKYPKFPSQFANNLKNNSYNNNFNNNQQNNNMYRNNNNNFSNNNKNNQFSNYNNNVNRNTKNNYNNRNNNYNINNKNLNNNFNSNYSNNNYNRNNNSNYNNNQNYNQNNNNNNYNNNNYYRSNTNFTSNRVNNNNFNNFRNNNDTFDIISFKQTLGNRLLKLNAWIDDGKYSYNSGQLKEGMKEILTEIPKCDYMMNRYQLNSDKRGYEIARNLKMDIEQTCARYEDLVNERNVEKFRSSFTGNSRQYYYNKSLMFPNSSNSSPMNDFNSYFREGNSGSGYGYSGQNYGNTYQKEESIGDKLSDYGGKVKDGFCFVGEKIKDTAISGFNFVKNKLDEDKDLEDI